MKSKTQLTIEGLLNHGFVEEAPLQRYRVFSHVEKQHKVFVGRAGALRAGPMISKAWSITDNRFHQRLIIEALKS